MITPSKPWTSRRRLWWALLWGLLAFSLALRLWHAAWQPDANRQFDERYSLVNLSRLLDGEWRPKQAYYLALSYLPQGAVLAASEQVYRLTGAEVFAVRDTGSEYLWTPTAYVLSRWVVALYSIVAMFVVFLLGRRLYDERVGLLGAALLGAFQRHLTSSGEFKPDTLVMLFTLIAAYITVGVARDPSWKRFAWIGVAIGCALSSKLTGGSAALPAIAAVLFLGWRRLDLWLRLMFSAAVSVATFVAFNPFLLLIMRHVARLQRDYGVRAAEEDSGHAYVFWRQIEYLWDHHTWPVFLFLLLGVVGMTRLAFSAAEDRQRRLGSFILVAQIVGYSLLHGAGTTLFRGQNFLSVAPFSSLVAAWAAILCWDRATARWAVLRRPVLAVSLWSVIGLALLAKPSLQAYRTVIPSNWDVAWKHLAETLRPLAHRQVAYSFFEPQRLRLVEGRDVAVTLRGPLEPSFERTLELSDAELFAERETEIPGSFAARRLAAIENERIFASRFWVTQGDAVVLVDHPWRQDVRPDEPALVPTRSAKGLRLELPADLAPGDVVSFEILVPRGESRLRELRVGEETLLLPKAGIRPRKARLMSPRTRLPAGLREVYLVAPPEVRPAGIEVRVVRFTPWTSSAN